MPQSESPAPASPPSLKSRRLTSLDAYRGFVMLAMASGGLAIANVWHHSHDEIVKAGGSADLWSRAAYQFEHTTWVGCSFWDLIQPSFMFMVGAALPFSYHSRRNRGDSAGKRMRHVIARAITLILLGVFLSSNHAPITNFSFVNVLTQIGLGYVFVYVLVDRPIGLQLVAIAAILGGYWAWNWKYEIPEAEQQQVEAALQAAADRGEIDLADEPKPFTGEFASHFNKHTNAAAAVDRKLLNRFPRAPIETKSKTGDEPETETSDDGTFWFNRGGYQTLNFVPSIATMIFGLIAGTVLYKKDEDQRKFKVLLAFSVVCFIAAMAADTKIWPFQIESLKWSLCPTVKRIWTPTWAVFSAGWCFFLMAMFFVLFDMLPLKKLGFPLVVVGMNSIAFYMMSQLMKPWLRDTLKTHLSTIDQVRGTSIVSTLFGSGYTAPIYLSLAVLFAMWLIAWWMYCRKVFIRI